MSYSRSGKSKIKLLLKDLIILSGYKDMEYILAHEIGHKIANIINHGLLA